MILEPSKIKSAIVSPSICHEVMGPDAMLMEVKVVNQNENRPVLLNLECAYGLSEDLVKMQIIIQQVWGWAHTCLNFYKVLGDAAASSPKTTS